MSRWSPLRVCLALAVTCLAVACGGDGGPAGSPYSPIIRVVAQGEFVALPAAGADFANAANAMKVVVVNNPIPTGSLRAGLRWTSASNKMEAAFFIGECTAEQVIGEACEVARYFTTAQLVTGRTLDLPSANAGNYTLAMVNLGPDAESGTYEVDLVLPTSGSTY